MTSLPARPARHADAGAAGRAESLGRALADLGGPGAAFARYLSTRVELLPAVARDALASAGPPTAALPFATVETVLRLELRADPRETFRSLEPHPLGWSALFQWHRAEAADGGAVVVKLVRPEAETMRTDGTERLRSLAARQAPELWPELPAAVDDFARQLDRRLDLRREGADLLRLAPDAFVTPRRTQASARLVWYDAPAGRPLVEELEAAAEDGPSEARDRPAAHPVCLAWLRQALHGELFAEDFDPADVWVREDDRVVLAGGSFGSLRPDARVALQIHLSAAARAEPEAAALALLRVVDRARHAVSRTELRDRFRQAEPFREGLGFAPYRGRRIADQLFVLWRQAREAGYPPEPATLGFYRGLSGLERLARSLAPGSDALASALDDVRILVAVRDLTQLLAPSRLPETLARALPPLLDLMRRAERSALLGEALAVEDPEETRVADRGPWSWTVTAGAVGLFVAAALVGERWLSQVLGPQAGARAAAAFVVAAGAFALWVVARSGR